MPIILDIETSTFFRPYDKRPREMQLKEMVFGIAVTYNDYTKEWREWGIKDLVPLWKYLQNTTVCGWNIVNFDIPVIRLTLQGDGYPADDSIRAWDIFNQVKEKTGRWYSLNVIAKANLGREKTADGAQAALWLQEWLSTQDDALLRKAFDYCRNDVWLEYSLYAHLQTGKPLVLPPIPGKGFQANLYYHRDGSITDGSSI